MKLTKSKLKQIIKEEIHTLIESDDITPDDIMTNYLQSDTYKGWDEIEKQHYAKSLVPLKKLINHWDNEDFIIKSILDYWKLVIKQDYNEGKFIDHRRDPEDAVQYWLEHVVPFTPGQPEGEDNAFVQAAWAGEEYGPAGMANEWKKIEAKYKTLWDKIQPHVHYAVKFWKSPSRVSQKDFWDEVYKRLHLEEQKQKFKQIIKEELENLDSKATDEIPDYPDNKATDTIPKHPGNVAEDAKSLSQALLGYYGETPGRGLQWAFSKDDFGAGDGDDETKNIASKMHNFILSVIPERYNFDKRIKDFRDELEKQSAKNKYAAQAVIDLDAVIEKYNEDNEEIRPVNLKET